MRYVRTIFAAALLMLMISATGCAEATIATASTIAGMAATGLSTGSDVYKMGKLDSVEMADFEELINSVPKAANDMGFTMIYEEYWRKGMWRCSMRDERDSKVRVDIDRRSKTLCRVKVDVGLMGSEPTARLFLARMRMHLPKPTTQPVRVELISPEDAKSERDATPE